MTTVIPLKSGVHDPITGDVLDSFETFEHHDDQDMPGEYLVVTFTDDQAARLAALIVDAIGTEPVAGVLDDPDLVEALSRVPDEE